MFVVSGKLLSNVIGASSSRRRTKPKNHSTSRFRGTLGRYDRYGFRSRWLFSLNFSAWGLVLSAALA